MRGLGILGDKILTFVPQIIDLSKKLEAFDKSMANQLLRSGTSIGANCHEAQSAQSKADFISKLHIALKENDETEYWLKMFYASKAIEEPLFLNLHSQSIEIGKLLTTILKNTKQNMEISRFI